MSARSPRVRQHGLLCIAWLLASGVLLGCLPALAQTLPTPPVRVNGDSPGTRQVEPCVAIDPLDTAHLVLVAEESDNRDDSTTRVRVFVSDDGGQTWRTTGLLPGDSSRQANPSVSYCADGVVWAMFQDVNPGITFQAFRSLDGGATWEKRTPARQADSALDNPLLVCDGRAGPFSGRRGREPGRHRSVSTTTRPVTARTRTFPRCGSTPWGSCGRYGSITAMTPAMGSSRSTR